MTPLERAARALCEMAGNPPAATMNGKPLWQDYLPEVRTVITAIRDPSQAMIYASSEGGLGFNDQVIENWQAMIDALIEAG